MFTIFSSLLGIFFCLILNGVLVGASMASHESDQVKVPPNHATENANWVHKRSKWKCKINGCINTYAAKWLLYQHLDNKHKLHMEVGKYSCPSTHVGGPTQQNHHAMNVQIMNNPHVMQK